jgi:hypothetical protein
VGVIDVARSSDIALNTLHTARGGKDRGVGAPAGQTQRRRRKAFGAEWWQLGDSREPLNLGSGLRVWRRGGHRGAGARRADSTGA